MRISDWSSDVCSSDLEESKDGIAHELEHMPAILIDRLDKAVEIGVEQPHRVRRAEACRMPRKIVQVGDQNPSIDQFTIAGPDASAANLLKIGRASCRERVCQ